MLLRAIAQHYCGHSKEHGRFLAKQNTRWDTDPQRWDVQALFCCRRHQPMRGHFGRLVTRSSFVTTATVLLAITASSRKNPNSATLSGSEIKKLNFGGKQKYAAAKALANEVRTPTAFWHHPLPQKLPIAPIFIAD
jgi:hypothetical protein